MIISKHNISGPKTVKQTIKKKKALYSLTTLFLLADVLHNNKTVINLNFQLYKQYKQMHIMFATRSLAKKL